MSASAHSRVKSNWWSVSRCDQSVLSRSVDPVITPGNGHDTLGQIDAGLRLALDFLT